VAKFKYNNIPSICEGVKFASKGEAKRYRELLLLKAAGEIDDLQLQVKYPLIVNGTRVAFYVADFTYNQNGSQVIEDFKGVSTAIFRLKWKILQAMFAEDKNIIFRISN
jgi:hypothetical protein